MLDPATTSRLMRSLRGDDALTKASQGALSELSGREREILELIGEGLTNSQIGNRLYL